MVGAIVVIIFVAGGAAWFGTHPLTVEPKRETRFAPYIPLKQLIRMPGYKKPCRSEEDCEAPFTCVDDLRFDARICRVSECESDLQCQENEVCQPAETLGTLVRLCLNKGTQDEGGSCNYFPLKSTEGCKPGLSCSFGTCTKPCRPDQPSDCPRGTFCTEYFGQKSCLPTCLETGCPAGTECVRPFDQEEDDRFSLCLKVVGSSCLHTPCPQGEKCHRETKLSHGLSAWCMSPCDAHHPCAQGNICFEHFCHRVCQADAPPSACPPEQECIAEPYYGYLCTRSRD